MRARREPDLIVAPRLLALVVGILVVVAGAADLGHGLEHATVTPTVHDEASHPDADSHFDGEDHLGLASTTVCLQGTLVVDPIAGWSHPTFGGFVPAPASADAAPLGQCISGCRSRAPPA